MHLRLRQIFDYRPIRSPHLHTPLHYCPGLAPFSFYFILGVILFGFISRSTRSLILKSSSPLPPARNLVGDRHPNLQSIYHLQTSLGRSQLGLRTRFRSNQNFTQRTEDVAKAIIRCDRPYIKFQIKSSHRPQSPAKSSIPSY